MRKITIEVRDEEIAEVMKAIKQIQDKQDWNGWKTLGVIAALSVIGWILFGLIPSMIVMAFPMLTAMQVKLIQVGFILLIIK